MCSFGEEVTCALSSGLATEEGLVSARDPGHPTDPARESPSVASPASSAAGQPRPHPSPSPPPAPAPPTSVGQVYLQAAAIFQRLRKDGPITHQLLHYGEKVNAPLPEGSADKTALTRAYQLAFNTLKYQDFLENILIDSCFQTAHQIPDDWLPLTMVMLFDLQDRKFQVNRQPAKEGEELLQEVKELQSCFQRSKTKLAASLARRRVKDDLLSVSCVLRDPVRTKHNRAKQLPLYAWVDTSKKSVEEVCEELRAEGLCEVPSGTADRGETSFCRDPLCPDTLRFPPQLRSAIANSRLTTGHVLNLQDRGACTAVSALCPSLPVDGDVLVVGSFSALTVAHVAVHAAARSGRVLLCGADHTSSLGEELQVVLTRMDIKNVRVLPGALCGLQEWDAALQRLKVVLVLPRCSCSGLSDPVTTILRERGDVELLQDLSQGPVSQSKMAALLLQQERLLGRAVTFSKVQVVLYCTRSVYPEENEQQVKRAIERAKAHPKLLPMRATGPIFPETPGTEPGGEEPEDRFFWTEPSDHSDGCFVAKLVRKADPAQAESVQDVLARAAAKGLLGDVFLDQSKPRLKGRRGGGGRRALAAAAAATADRSDLPGGGGGRDGGTASTAPEREDASAPLEGEEEEEEGGEAAGEDEEEEEEEEGRAMRRRKKGKGLSRGKGKPRRRRRRRRAPARPRGAADKKAAPRRVKRRRRGGPTSRGRRDPLTPALKPPPATVGRTPAPPPPATAFPDTLPPRPPLPRVKKPPAIKRAAEPGSDRNEATREAADGDEEEEVRQARLTRVDPLRPLVSSLGRSRLGEAGAAPPLVPGPRRPRPPT